MCAQGQVLKDNVNHADRSCLINVFVYTLSGVYSGYILRQNKQRLLDALNKGYCTHDLKVCTEFLPLHNVDVQSPGEDSLHLDTLYISTKSILFVGELDIKPQPPMPGVYPLRRKKTIKTVLKLPQINLTGNMYSETWEELQDSLCRTDRFVPVTDVEFKPRLESGISKLDFVAVNTDHIVFVGAK